MQVGLEVGGIARGLHQDGVLIDGRNLTSALVDTADQLAARPRRALFEASFEYRGVLVRTDLLLPAKRGWRLVEVKASASVKPVHPADVAIQAWVAEGAGVRLAETALACIDTGFVYSGEGDYRGLLAEHPMGEEIEGLRTEVPKWIRAARATLAGPEPDIEPGDQCTDPYACPFLEHCVPPQEETGYPPEILPRARPSPRHCARRVISTFARSPPGVSSTHCTSASASPRRAVCPSSTPRRSGS